MGVDKPNIRTVFHLREAPTAADYLQEAGRGGRDGKPAKALVFQPDVVHRSPAVCRRQSLLAAFGEEQVSCSGCDVCRGQSEQPPRDAGQALMSLKRQIHRLDRQQTRSYLFGRNSPALWESGLSGLGRWGLWADEDDLTCNELWKGLENGGWIRFHRWGPWKGLLANGTPAHSI